MATYPAMLDLIDAAAAPILGVSTACLGVGTTDVASIAPRSPSDVVAQASIPVRLTEVGAAWALGLPAARALELVLVEALDAMGPDAHADVRVEWGAAGVGLIVTGAACPVALGHCLGPARAALERAGGTIRVTHSEQGPIVSAVIPRAHRRWPALRRTSTSTTRTHEWPKIANHAG